MSEKNGKNADGQKMAVRENLAREFEERHQRFLAELKQMPRSTKEEKERRWNCLKKYPLYDVFIQELMDAYRPGAYERLYLRLGNVDRVNTKDMDIASYRSKELDTKVFMEAVYMAVSGYTGVNRIGEHYGFVASVGQIYRQEAGKTSAQNELQRLGISDSDIPRKKLQNMLRLARTVKELCEKNPGMDSPEDVLERMIQEGTYRCGKKELELVRGMVSWERITCSIDESAGDDKNGTTMKDFLVDDRDEQEAVLMREEGQQPFLEMFCHHMEENWESIKSAKGKQEQERIRIFLTKDILKELKLDENKEAYLQEPAGDEEFYNSLKPQGEILYEKVFYPRYLLRAFVENPGNFYEVYARLLRKDFKFSDEILAQLMGKNKSTISRWRTAYEDMMNALHKYYLNMQ